MNRFFTLLFAASCLTAGGQVPDYVPTEGLVAWYSLDANGQDEWGGNNPDYYSATPTTNRFGAPNRALNFQEGEEQFIRGEASGFPISDRTVAFWMKTTFEFGKTWPFGYGGGPSCNTGVGRSSVLYFNTNDCGAAGKVAHTAHCCTSVLTSPFNSSTDWTFWCYTNDANGLKIYQNGELIGVGASAEDVQTSSAKFFIGSAVSGDGTSRYAQFTGALDDLGLWDRALTEDEISELYSSIQGCVDELACNYNGDPEVISLPESCDYSCCPGPGCCHEGTIWDSNLQQCIVANPSDSNLDGCVQLNDLLDLLSAYGNCGAEESAWQCGDPLEYQGYDYQTVQIGEQCWFAENLRAENYRNGDSISHIPDAMEWVESEQGAWVWYSNGSEGESYGRLYNSYVVTDARQVCPSGWRVFSTEDWNTMTSLLDDFGNVSSQLKSSLFWPEGAQGSNSSGFAGLPGGYRSVDGSFELLGETARWWTTNTSGAFQVSRGLNLTGTYGSSHYLHIGFSIRCIKNAE